jgi:NDP-sugar pyrophosphorylase family protein
LVLATQKLGGITERGTVQAIVMAAGEGRRLRPVTELWPKPMLPIDGRPVIATLLRQLDDEGFGPVTVVTGHLEEQLERLLAGLDLTFAHQPAPDGSADAVRSALAAGAGLPAVVLGADTVFQPGDLARFREAFASSGAAGALAYRPDPRKARVDIEDGLVRRVVDADASKPFSSAPLWGLTTEVGLENLPGPPYELSAAFQLAIDAGKTIAGIEIGPTRDLTDVFDLVRENFPYLETYERKRDL